MSITRAVVSLHGVHPSQALPVFRYLRAGASTAAGGYLSGRI
jgi:hypothetical protein